MTDHYASPAADDQLGLGLDSPSPSPLPPTEADVELNGEVPQELVPEDLAPAIPEVVPQEDIRYDMAQEPPDRIAPTNEPGLFDAPRDPTVMARSSLDEYVIPPFSILDTRQVKWQDRKRAWLRYSIKSEIGREEKLTYGKFNQNHKEKLQDRWSSMTDEERIESGTTIAHGRFIKDHTRERYGAGSTSVFDPVLTEIMYRWLCPAGGLILDPFAGGSVRGIVAACLGHPYIGIELRGIQVEANREQAKDILRPGAVTDTGVVIPTPLWVQGDSDYVISTMHDEPDVDLVFTCPPYGNLETYSDDPADLSNMKNDEFDAAYRRILCRAVGRMRDNRFAVIVVSNIRDKATGNVRDLVGLTCDGMEDGGAQLYNEVVLINVAGTAAIRAKKQFVTSRKLARVHQSVLCFVKGDARKATDAIEQRAAS